MQNLTHIILFQQTKTYPSEENEWLWRYVQGQDCAYNQSDSTGPISNQECIYNIDKLKPEDILQTALRVEDILTASQAVVLVAQSLQLAWESVCLNHSMNPCPDLVNMLHEDFQQPHFTKVLQNQRSGLKLPQPNKDWLREPGLFPNLLLVEYIRSGQHKTFINLHKVSKINYYFSLL
jgi:hypothetical protein